VSGGVPPRGGTTGPAGRQAQRRLAKDLGISDVTLRHRLKEEKTARGERPCGLSRDERDELNRRRDENAELRMEREILRKAAVSFAKEDDGREAEVYSFIAADKTKSTESTAPRGFLRLPYQRLLRSGRVR
jgi:transposase